MAPSDLVVRPFRPTDRDAVYDVCVRTADDGGDARGQLATDDLPGDVFAGPYLALEPELCFVVDDGHRAVGYVLGTADTARWAVEQATSWLPVVAHRYPLVEPPTTREAQWVHLLHHPEHLVHAGLADHPAHLHIDLVPQAQGQGLGRVLVRTFLAALRERGVPGVHLGVSPTNTRARGFYARIGLRELAVDAPGVIYLGASTDLVV